MSIFTYRCQEQYAFSLAISIKFTIVWIVFRPAQQLLSLLHWCAHPHMTEHYSEFARMITMLAW